MKSAIEAILYSLTWTYVICGMMMTLIHYGIAWVDFTLNALPKNKTQASPHSWHLSLRYFAWSFFLWPHFLHSFLTGKTIYR